MRSRYTREGHEEERRLSADGEQDTWISAQQQDINLFVNRHLTPLPLNSSQAEDSVIETHTRDGLLVVPGPRSHPCIDYKKSVIRQGVWDTASRR